MPWRSSTTFCLRKKFVSLAVAENANLSELCQCFSISRKTGYKWIQRYRLLGDQGLNDISRRPHCSPTQVSEPIKEIVIALSRTNPSWGGRKISKRIEELGQFPLQPPSTITGILYRYRESCSGDLPLRLTQKEMPLRSRLQGIEQKMQWLEFMLKISRKNGCFVETEHHRTLLEIIATCKKRHDRTKAIAVLAHFEGFSASTISRYLGIARKSCSLYLKKYLEGGTQQLLFRKEKLRKANDRQIKDKVFSILHTPPSSHDINRTTWKIDDLRAILKKDGISVGSDIVREIIRTAGYRWKKARVVLTSNDPQYHEKLSKITKILSTLKEDERFFSIDEYGPFAVKTRGGRALLSPQADYTVPQWQKSKGSLIVTAALELSRNQITHFYSDRKNTVEMIRLIQKILTEYSEVRNIYLSWDAASWHVSKILTEFIDDLNTKNSKDIGPCFFLIPLPARAQFLNVIESVFSGMSRAIIHNSNYETVDDAKESIDRYFSERNSFFTINPKRAGRKIWQHEKCLPNFDVANNCKSPLYR